MPWRNAASAKAPVNAADKPYAFEELVAELGAASLCAELGATAAPCPDHAQYIAQYLT
jgi:antirestriction protein ArdC